MAHIANGALVANNMGVDIVSNHQIGDEQTAILETAQDELVALDSQKMAVDTLLEA